MTARAGRAPRPTVPPAQGTEADLWSAMSLVISGVLMWGLIGWGLASWLHVKALVGLGVLLGGVLGVLSVYLRYGRGPSGPVATPAALPPDTVAPDLPSSSSPAPPSVRVPQSHSEEHTP